MEITGGHHITGGVVLKSNLSIMELGQIISNRILGGMVLGGLDKRIYDEVPAIFNHAFGFIVVLHGYPGLDGNSAFCFDIVPNFRSGADEGESINFSQYLVSVFKEKLKDVPNIQIIGASILQ